MRWEMFIFPPPRLSLACECGRIFRGFGRRTFSHRPSSIVRQVYCTSPTCHIAHHHDLLHHQPLLVLKQIHFVLTAFLESPIPSRHFRQI